MTKRQLVEQPTLPRAVCMAVHNGEVCTLLKGHTGKCVSSKGRTW